jgi:hypothetical protein
LRKDPEKSYRSQYHRKISTTTKSWLGSHWTGSGGVERNKYNDPSVYSGPRTVCKAGRCIETKQAVNPSFGGVIDARNGDVHGIKVD